MLKCDEIKNLKGRRKLTMLTAYDYPTAQVLHQCDIDMILVGDSLGMVVLGYKDTKSVTLEDMMRHGAAVKRGAGESLVIVDMPINTFNDSDSALANARKVIEATGCDAVKIEGRADIVEVLVKEGILTCGHTGLKPQSALKYGMVGSQGAEALEVMNEARALADAGAFCVVLECVPSQLAKKITDEIAVPTIGIGSGTDCDGQVLVISDLLGLYQDFKPKFAKQYVDLAELMRKAVKDFQADVSNLDYLSPLE